MYFFVFLPRVIISSESISGRKWSFTRRCMERRKEMDQCIMRRVVLLLSCWALEGKQKGQRRIKNPSRYVKAESKKRFYTHKFTYVYTRESELDHLKLLQCQPRWHSLLDLVFLPRRWSPVFFLSVFHPRQAISSSSHLFQSRPRDRRRTPGLKVATQAKTQLWFFHRKLKTETQRES